MIWSFITISKADFIGILVLLFAIIVLQQLISWVGSCTYNIGCDKLQYAYFVFTSDRQAPMTTNVLMNLFIPNVAMTIIYDIYSFYGLNVSEYVWLFTPCYFLWRAILICIVLRRPEFYNIKYEGSIAIVATIISYSVFVGILLRSQPFFLQVDDLREELGFAIAIAIYGFVKMAVDSKVKQSDVVSSSDLANYIKRKFDCFYRRYKKDILIKNGAGEIWIILFSIMIFEDFNRGTFKRTAEYVLFPFRKKATLGIMQVETDKYITSLDSIRLAYNRIEHDYLELENEHDWESIVYEIAIRYNSDERYGENVSYIYHVLREYIVESAEFRADFGVSKDPNKYYINVLNVTEDRLNDLLSTCDKQTDLGDGCVKDTNHEQKFRVEKDGTSSRLHFENVSNALIDFAEHNSIPDAVSSIVVKECQNVEFLNMSITNTAGKCAIIVKDSSTITFKDSRLNVMDSKTIKVKNSSIILNGIQIESNDEERLKP